jgi:hypothetical protein
VSGWQIQRGPAWAKIAELSPSGVRSLDFDRLLSIDPKFPIIGKTGMRDFQ